MKNTKFKKSLSILLSVIMLVATCAISFGVSVSAATTTAQEELITFFEEETEFVALISDLTSARETALSTVEDLYNYRYQIYTITEGCSYFVYVLADYDDYLLFVELIDLIKAASVELMANDPITAPTVNSLTFTAWNNYTLCVDLQDAVTTSGTTDATTYNKIIGAVCPGSNNAAAMPTSAGSSSYSGNNYAYAGATVTTTDGVGYLEYVDTENDYGMTYSLSYNMDVYTSIGYSICYLSSEDSIVADVVDSSALPTYMSYADVVTLLKTTDSYYGSCGDSVYYAFSKSTGTLYIYGEGTMDNYGSETYVNAPWYAFKDSIKSIVIEESVTSVSAYGFYQYSNVTSISLPTTLEEIGSNAFRETSITSIVIPEGVETIYSGTFRMCYSLTTVYIPSSVEEIVANAFGGDTAITTIYYPGTEAEYDSITISTTGNPAFFYTTLDVQYNHECSNVTIIEKTSSACTVSGTIVYECNDCGRVYTVETDGAVGHMPVADTSKDVAATCSSTGWGGATKCEVCGEAIYAGASTAKLAHTWSYDDEYVIDTPATCTTGGSMSIHCSECDEIITETVTVIPADGDSHTFDTSGEYTYTYTASNCTVNGSIYGYCTVCEGYVTQTLDLDPDNHVDEDGSGRCDRCSADMSTVDYDSLSFIDKIMLWINELIAAIQALFSSL